MAGAGGGWRPYGVAAPDDGNGGMVGGGGLCVRCSAGSLVAGGQLLMGWGGCGWGQMHSHTHTHTVAQSEPNYGVLEDTAWVFVWSDLSVFWSVCVLVCVCFVYLGKSLVKIANMANMRA